jgi:hypothetical protein
VHVNRVAKYWLSGTLGFIVFMAVWVWLCPYFWTNVIWGVRAGLFWIIPLAVLAMVVTFLALVAAVRHENGERYGGYVIAAVLVGVCGLFNLIWWGTSLHSYAQNAVYADSVTVVTDGVPQLGQRAPFQIASAQARPDLGASQGTIDGTHYQPTTNEFSSLIVRNSGSGFVGYESVLEQTIPLTGHGTGKTCQFDPNADLRISGNSLFGFFNHNLGRAISEQQRWLSYDDGDVYGFCAKDGTPMVVVPLVQQTGFWVVTELPAGVALYNGKTGAITFQNDAKGLPGSAYPLSLAALQRASTPALSDYSAWWSGTAGYETDNENTNSSNNAEFVLPSKDKKQGYYVTPLTGRGNATAISAISTMSNEGRNGSLSSLTVHNLSTVWLSPTAIEQRIKADFPDLPGWQNNALKVEELAPVDGSHYVVTLGNDQNILYRVTGTGSLQPADKADCLERVDNDKLTQVRCGTAANVGTNGPGAQYGPNPTSGGSVPSLGDLSALTPQQLAALEQQLTQEINRRMGVK